MNQGGAETNHFVCFLLGDICHGTLLLHGKACVSRLCRLLACDPHVILMRSRINVQLQVIAFYTLKLTKNQSLSCLSIDEKVQQRFDKETHAHD